jgi:predicted ATPase
MKIKRLFINNYKSLVNFELVGPNPFSVFVGPNAAGKSNVFEALEFLTFTNDFVRMDNLFGGAKEYLNKNLQKLSELTLEKPLQLSINLQIGYANIGSHIDFYQKNGRWSPLHLAGSRQGDQDLVHEGETNEQWFNRIFSRIFIQNKRLVKINIKTPYKLSLDAENIAAVLQRVLENEAIREEILDWMQLLVPEFEDLLIRTDPVSGDSTLLVKERHTGQFFDKNMLSDGTYNILALLTAVYQSDEPQFLCIEEPENGLNPYVVRTLVGFFRQMCEEKGHYIWLNTHSATLVKELQPKELILINKIDGVTKPSLLDPNLKFKSMPLDEAWLTNTLGGGLPW